MLQRILLYLVSEWFHLFMVHAFISKVMLKIHLEHWKARHPFARYYSLIVTIGNVTMNTEPLA